MDKVVKSVKNVRREAINSRVLLQKNQFLTKKRQLYLTLPKATKPKAITTPEATIISEASISKITSIPKPIQHLQQ